MQGDVTPALNPQSSEDFTEMADGTCTYPATAACLSKSAREYLY